jgi:hypothetical protein
MTGCRWVGGSRRESTQDIGQDVNVQVRIPKTALNARMACSVRFQSDQVAPGKRRPRECHRSPISKEDALFLFRLYICASVGSMLPCLTAVPIPELWVDVCLSLFSLAGTEPLHNLDLH